MFTCMASQGHISFDSELEHLTVNLKICHNKYLVNLNFNRKIFNNKPLGIVLYLILNLRIFAIK